MMEEFEKLQIQLAETVLFMRSMVLCPYHELSFVLSETHDGLVCAETPICMAPIIGESIDCVFRDCLKELIDNSCELLGTKDMSRFI